MRILISGGTGLIGGNLCVQAARQHQAWATDVVAAPDQLPGVTWLVADLTDREQVAAVFQQARPQAVVHCAAISNIDLAQREQELAWAVNVTGSRHVAELCREWGARLVACSTDTVFDGVRGGYREDDPPSPVNWYGQTKVEMERLVAALAPSWAVARLSMVYGLPALAGPPGYLERLLSSLEAGKATQHSEAELRTPVDALTVRDALLELATGDYQGLLHVAGRERVSRRELARRVAARVGADPVLVQPEPQLSPGKAARPRDASLESARAGQVLATPMLDVAQGLERVLPTR